MCGYVGTCLHILVKATDHTGYLPQLLSYYFLREVSLNLVLTVQLAQLANTSSCLCLTFSGITRMGHYAQLFLLLLDIPLAFRMCNKHFISLCTLSYFFSPLHKSD